MKKHLPTDAITSELTRSVFFQKSSRQQAQDQPQESRHASVPDSPTPAAYEEQPSEEAHQAGNAVGNRGSTIDVMNDGMTSHLQGVNFKQWQEIIEDTETQNSALRLKSEERYAVEDVVNELRRQYGIKTSMNEIARLGLLLLIRDFKQQKKASIIHQVKKA